MTVLRLRAMDDKRPLLLDPHLAILCTPETLVYGASEALGLGAAIKVVAEGPEATFLAPAPLRQKRPVPRRTVQHSLLNFGCRNLLD